ncbi:MAG: EAL domain-containing protein, partial [Gammaproteobacteria bacterium]|nr:EAL domain-containing protein [Gammaproteobacteria bacterium]
KVNLTNGSFIKVKDLNDARVSYIHIDDQGIYVSTASRGIFHFDRKLNTLLEQNDNELLETRSIYAVIVDENKGQWLATDNGVISIRRNGDKYVFDQSHGLQGADFNDNSALLASDGTVLFGGVNGLNYIHRNNFDAMLPNNAELKFTEFNLFNKAVKIGPDANGFSRISRSIVTKPDITLNYSDYPFEVAFNLINYPYADQISFRYRIPGVDHDWIGTNSFASATYTSLSFGSYQLEVEAYLSGSTKAVATNSIRIEVLPPLWLSNWALLGYFVVVMIIVLIVARVISQGRATAFAIKVGADRLKLSLWGSGDEMWDWHITENKMFHTAQWDILDYDGFCDPTLSKLHPDDRETTQKLLQSHLAGDCEYFEANYRIRRKNETQWIWILDRAKVVERNAAGAASRMTGTIRDISKIKAAELKLTLQAEAIENISDAIYILDLDYNIVEANKAFETITGYQRSQVFGTGKIFDSYQSNMADLIRAKLNKGEGWSGELKAQRPNGDCYYIELNINTIVENELITHYVAAFSDITNRKQTEIELRNLSNVDTLTKLPNRSYFQHAHRNLIRRNQPHALLTLDIDNFKKINDSMGHDHGDNLLCLISERIDQQIQCQHLLCRLGSDEFAILLEDVDQISTITQVLYEIEVALQEPFVLNNQVLVMSCSVGIGIFPTDGRSTENMLQSADTAMYHAKSDSGFSYKFYSASMNESAVRRLQIESLIREALKNDWFEVYYQPKYSAATGLLTGMEALVRLIHPEKGMISPNEFIPVAEDTGLVIEIGEIVLRKACYVTQLWRRSGLFNGRVAVNLAARQFAQTDLVKRISHILDCTQLPVSNLELEITEGTVIEDPEMAIVTMQSLTDLGISLALDDFGTGYSSLSYLKRFPIHTLKIDKAFIDDLIIEQGERHMVASIISIAHNMGLSVVAEGVETKEQLEILKQLSCETIQGFLFSRPLSESDFLALLLRQESRHSDKIVPN